MRRDALSHGGGCDLRGFGRSSFYELMRNDIHNMFAMYIQFGRAGEGLDTRI